MPRSAVHSLPLAERQAVRAGARDALRSRLLASARVLFREHAYEDVTVRMIAAHADVALGTVYKHFGAKGDLWRAAMPNKPLVERPAKRHADRTARALRGLVDAVRSGDAEAIGTACAAAETILGKLAPPPSARGRRSAPHVAKLT